jgi:hypothetical protein
MNNEKESGRSSNRGNNNGAGSEKNTSKGRGAPPFPCILFVIKNL